jgi:hypothetical protein
VLAAIDEVVRTTGATRLSFDVKQDTAIVLAQLAAWESRKHFVELCVVPSYRIATDWFRRGHEWLRAFEALAPVQRLALERLGDRCTVARGKHGLVIDFQGSRESSIRMMLGHLAPIERLTLRGKIDTYSKPSAWIKNTVKKLRAKKAVVDVYDDWRSYTEGAISSSPALGRRAAPTAIAIPVIASMQSASATLFSDSPIPPTTALPSSAAGSSVACVKHLMQPTVKPRQPEMNVSSESRRTTSARMASGAIA